MMSDHDGMLTVQQVMEELEVSRQTVHSLAQQFGWQTKKQGNSRLYLATDVRATPDEAERKRLGYKRRSLGAGIPQRFFVQRGNLWALPMGYNLREARQLGIKLLGGEPEVCRMAYSDECERYYEIVGHSSGLVAINELGEVQR